MRPRLRLTIGLSITVTVAVTISVVLTVRPQAAPPIPSDSTASPASGTTAASTSWGTSSGGTAPTRLSTGNSTNGSDTVRAMATLTVSRTNYTGSCPPPKEQAPQFQATIGVTAGPVEVRYHWRTSNGGSSDPDWHVLRFTGTGAQEQKITYTHLGYLPDSTIQDWVAVDVNSPASLQSNRVAFTTTCTPTEPPKVTATASATRTSYTGACPPPADRAPSFKGLIDVSRGPVTVQYQWLTSNGGSSDPSIKTITFNGTGPQQQTVYFTETSYLPGDSFTDWIALYTVAPATTESNHVTFTTTCT